eukprot:244228-Hanusia_phi.AAC.1
MGTLPERLRHAGHLPGPPAAARSPACQSPAAWQSGNLDGSSLVLLQPPSLHRRPAGLSHQAVQDAVPRNRVAAHCGGAGLGSERRWTIPTCWSGVFPHALAADSGGRRAIRSSFLAGNFLPVPQ